MTSPRSTRFVIAALVLLALLTPLGRELFVGDETKYSEVVREMRATGSWFFPPLEGTPFTHKPPLHFWMVGLLTMLFGTYSIWPFVIPSLGAFALLLYLMWRMGGWLAAFICGTSLMVWGSAQSARMDVAFTLLITAGIGLICRFFDEHDSGLLALAALALATATLLKGPMAPVIALVFFAIEAWRRGGVPRANVFPAVAILVVVPLLWFVPAMIAGGSAYTHEVLQKQLAGRAIGSWVHRSPPWYYLVHAPGYLFPWFLAFGVAMVRRWREERVNLNWIVAVLLPYTLMSSKLDVYMMALVPPVALVIARSIEVRWMRTANLTTLALMLMAGIAGLIVGPARVRQWDPAAVFAVRSVLTILVIVSLVAVTAAFRSALASTIALGFAPLVVFAWIAVTLMPEVNAIASTAPLVTALEEQHVAAGAIALYTCPHLWTRTMPRELEKVRYVSPQVLAGIHPEVVVTSRAHAAEIASQLTGYRRVRELRMIGKWFDVYRR